MSKLQNSMQADYCLTPSHQIIEQIINVGINKQRELTMDYLKTYQTLMMTIGFLSVRFKEIIDNQKKTDFVSRLNEMKNLELQSIEDSGLNNLEDVVIDSDLPIPERIMSFIEQIGNPYCYKSHGVIVKISFSGTDRLEECLVNCIL